MQMFRRASLAAITLVALGAARADAADLLGGSMKDGGYMPSLATRNSLIYVRGDASIGKQDFGSVTEAPAYTDSGASIGSSRFLGGGIGYYFSQNIRTDLTLDFSNRAAISGTVLDGRATVQGERRFGVKHMLGLANLYYDFGSRSGFSPYIGVGLGFARNTTTDGTVVISGCDTGTSGAPNCAAHMGGTTKSHVAGALMAGFSAKLAERVSLDAGYRFVYLGDAETGGVQITRLVNNPAWPQTAASVSVHDMYDHQFRLGVRVDVR